MKTLHKPFHIANLALALVVFGWLLSLYGVFSQMGDPHPDVPREEIVARHNNSSLILAIGILFILIAIWLSGYVFSSARKRSLLVILVCTTLFIAVFTYAFY